MTDAWSIVRAAAGAAEGLAREKQPLPFSLGAAGELRPAEVGHRDALLLWRPGAGWEALLRQDDPRKALVDLYLPICSATKARPITVGHLGQSLDGFIATHSGESQWVTGPENMLHMHRLRALCDAVIVGAGTVAADDPQLTTRLVEGPNPLRVVLDPTRRLTPSSRVFSDDAAETLYVCARSLAGSAERQFGRAAVAPMPDTAGGGVDVTELMRMLRERGCARVFVEGGGVTVSMFLEANLLDRLHVAVAPLLIGDGRPAIRFPPSDTLGECHRPRYRVFRMGGDVLFDLEMESRHPEGSDNQISQII
jgi:diaminohydroxyphosphoribosylaminopyrimidine deaminase / 5-amino-6-(5-phosphoribosylamino)uracil reductase